MKGKEDMTKRMLVCCVTVLFVLALCACEAPRLPTRQDKDTTAVSIERLVASVPVTAIQAKEMLERLETLGYTGEILFAFAATDDDDRTYYHLWVGEQTVDVYLQENGQVGSVVRSGILLYEAATAASDFEQVAEVVQTSEMVDIPNDALDEPVVCTLTVDDFTETVLVGERARFCAFGLAGEEYRIEVHYQSGIAQAKGLEPQLADEDGRLTWEWKIGGRTVPGTYDISVMRAEDARDTVTVSFSVLPTKE